MFSVNYTYDLWIIFTYHDYNFKKNYNYFDKYKIKHFFVYMNEVFLKNTTEIVTT